MLSRTLIQKTPLNNNLLVEFKDISYSYKEKPLFKNVNISIPRKSFMGVVGPSGCGKTTLLKILLGIVKPHEGDIKIKGIIVNGRPPPSVGYVPQLETIDWSFPVTVKEAVIMGRWRSLGPFPKTSDRQDTYHVLEKLGIHHLAKRHIRDLSGGEQQRVFLARALISNPELLVLDEPTSGVDMKTQHDILHLLGKLNSEGTTILLTTHDLNAVAAHLPHVICFNHGVIAQGMPEEVFTPEVLKQTYGADVTVFKHGEFMLMANTTPLSLKRR